MSVLNDLFDGLHRPAEEVQVKFLEFVTGERLGGVVTVSIGFDFKTGGLLVGKRTFRLLDFAFHFTHGMEVGRYIGTGLLLVLLDKVVN